LVAREDVSSRVSGVDPERGLSIEALPAQETTVRLHVGTSACGSAIRILPERYGARVMRGTTSLPVSIRRVHPLGAVTGASMGAAEAFKTMAQVSPAEGWTTSTCSPEWVAHFVRKCRPIDQSLYETWGTEGGRVGQTKWQSSESRLCVQCTSEGTCGPRPKSRRCEKWHRPVRGRRMILCRSETDA
jgi:hypothetical protein